VATTPTLEQVFQAVTDALCAMSPLPGTVLHYDNHYSSEVKLLDEHRNATTKECDVWLMDADTDTDQGESNDELYSIFRVKLRYLSVHVDGQDQWSRDARWVAELVRTTLENNDSVFAIGEIQPLLGTPKTVTARGGFVDKESTRWHEMVLEFSVEARRWS